MPKTSIGFTAPKTHSYRLQRTVFIIVINIIIIIIINIIIAVIIMMLVSQFCWPLLVWMAKSQQSVAQMVVITPCLKFVNLPLSLPLLLCIQRMRNNHIYIYIYMCMCEIFIFFFLDKNIVIKTHWIWNWIGSGLDSVCVVFSRRWRTTLSVTKPDATNQCLVCRKLNSFLRHSKLFTSRS